MEFETILYRVEERIAHITLNRPDRRNALSPTLRKELISAFKLAENDEEVSLILLSGAGESFSSGYDMGYQAAGGGRKEFPNGWVHDKNFDIWSGQYPKSCLRDWMTIWDLMKPVVAKVHGYCLAGGSELMSFCDIVFAADDAIIGYPPTRGQATSDIVYMPWKMSMAQAKYLMLTGNTVRGTQAAEMGWIAKSFPADQLDEMVMRELRPMSKIHPAQLSANKQAVNQAYDAMGMRGHLQNCWQWFTLSRNVRPGAGEFSKIAAEQGLKAAIKWRDQAFKDEGFDM